MFTPDWYVSGLLQFDWKLDHVMFPIIRGFGCIEFTAKVAGLAAVGVLPCGVARAVNAPATTRTARVRNAKRRLLPLSWLDAVFLVIVSITYVRGINVLVLWI